jgi:inhibitor of cysteine peptidase
MRHEDLMKKLENLKTPDIGLSSHRRGLRMFLLNSGRFRRRNAMDWVKVLAPVTAALLVIASLGVFAVLQPGSILPNLGGNQISKFTSYSQLQHFVDTNTQSQYAKWRDSSVWGAINGGLVPSAPSAAESDGDYSATNIQVAGVDEADIVKTDGDHIYVVSGNKTVIVKAYPPEQAEVLSEIEVTGTIAGIFVNGDRLVLFGQETPYYPYYYDDVIRLSGPTGEISMSYMPYYGAPKTFVKVYDISDRENPQLQRELSADGQYLSSRMIGDYAYVVISESVYGEDNRVELPRVYSGADGKGTEIPATDIYYSDVVDNYYTYTTIMAVNTQDDGQEPTYETILLGASSNLYVSLNNIYLTVPVWGGNVGDGEGTSIYRIQIDGDEMEYVASGEVPGIVLNQFSMDEYDGYFRVATTTWNEGNQNNVYVLNMSLNVTGALIDLAQGETIRSARFMGGRCYLVTFKQVDPLFVIDLNDPYDPEVLGYLKVTGYSDYLHPYDETHIIGIGKETTDAGEFAWYQGVKISLFDVSDVDNPVEISKLEIGDRGSDSPVLWDHKAFLFDRSRNLLVMPINEAKVNQADYPGGVPSWAYGEPVYQGTYVFNVTLDQGIQLKGRITHIENPDQLEQGYYYYYSPFAVERSLYIGDVLYTISQAKIMMNDLETLDYINEVELPHSSWAPYEPLPVEPGSVEPSGGGSGTVEATK